MGVGNFALSVLGLLFGWTGFLEIDVHLPQPNSTDSQVNGSRSWDVRASSLDILRRHEILEDLVCRSRSTDPRKCSSFSLTVNGTDYKWNLTKKNKRAIDEDNPNFQCSVSQLGVVTNLTCCPDTYAGCDMVALKFDEPVGMLIRAQAVAQSLTEHGLKIEPAAPDEYTPARLRRSVEAGLLPEDDDMLNPNIVELLQVTRDYLNYLNDVYVNDEDAKLVELSQVLHLDVESTKNLIQELARRYPSLLNSDSKQADDALLNYARLGEVKLRRKRQADAHIRAWLGRNRCLNRDEGQPADGGARCLGKFSSLRWESQNSLGFSMRQLQATIKRILNSPEYLRTKRVEIANMNVGGVNTNLRLSQLAEVSIPKYQEVLEKKHSHALIKMSEDDSPFLIDYDIQSKLHWKAKATVVPYEAKARVVLVADVGNTQWALASMLEEYERSRTIFSLQPDNSLARGRADGYVRTGMDSPYGISDIHGNFHLLVGTKVDPTLRKLWPGSSSSWGALDLIRYSSAEKLRACKHKLDAAVNIFSPVFEEAAREVRQVLGILGGAVAGLVGALGLGLAEWGFGGELANPNEVKANSQALLQIRKVLTKEDETVGHLLNTQAAMLNVMKEEAIAINSTSKLTHSLITNLLFEQLVDQGCALADAHVQAMELLRNHKLPMSLIDEQVLTDIIEEIRLHSVPLNLSPAIKTLTELAALPATSRITPHELSDLEFKRRTAARDQALRKANMTGVDLVPLSKETQVLSVIIDIPLGVTGEQHLSTVFSLGDSLVTFNNDTFRTLHGDLLMVPNTGSLSDSATKQIPPAYLESCYGHNRVEEFYCPGSRGVIHSDKCLETLAKSMEHASEEACQSMFVALDTQRPYFSLIDATARKAQVYVPVNHRLVVGCPGRGGFERQTWEWPVTAARGRSMILTAPRDYCYLKVQDPIGHGLHEYFLPAQIAQVHAPSSISQSFTDGLRLLGVLDQTTHSLDLGKYPDNLQEAIAHFGRANVTYRELQILSKKFTHPWLLLDLASPDHRKILFIGTASVVGVVLLIIIIHQYLHRRSRAQAREILREVKVTHDLDAVNRQLLYK